MDEIEASQLQEKRDRQVLFMKTTCIVYLVFIVFFLAPHALKEIEVPMNLYIIIMGFIPFHVLMYIFERVSKEHDCSMSEKITVSILYITASVLLLVSAFRTVASILF